jgi:hypothetical protein
MEINMRCRRGSIILEDYRSEIEEYCERNMLSVDKIYSSRSGCNNEAAFVFIMGEGDPSRGYLGMLDDVPLPVRLEIHLKNGKLRFVQTEHTHELRIDYAPAPQMPYAEMGKLAFA